MSSRLEVLLAQLDHHGHVVSTQTAGLSFAQATFELAPGRPSIAWCLGHLIANTRTVAPSLCGAPAPDPDDPDDPEPHDRPHFGVTDEDAWATLHARWAPESAAARAAVAALADADLDLPLTTAVHPAFRDVLTSREKFLRGHLFHLAYHAGQIGTLRAAQGLAWPDGEHEG